MSRRIFRQEVPVNFDGKVFLVKNVTKYTTCVDVVHMLILKAGLPIERISEYSLFEVTGSLERMLQARTRIIKILRSWGCEKDNFTFLMKKVEDEEVRLLKYKSYELQTNVHEKVSENQDEHTCDRTESKSDEVGLKPDEDLLIQKTKDILMKSKKPKRKIFLKKYLASLIPFQKSRRLAFKNVKQIKTENDKTANAENNSAENLMNDIDALLHSRFHNLEERCRYYWNSNSESDDDSDSEDEATFLREMDLNNAFLTGARNCHKQSDSNIEYWNLYTGDPNEAFLKAHNDVYDSSHVSDIFDDGDDYLSYSSDCELDRNMNTCEVVRNIFCGDSSCATFVEDGEIDSFMRTHINDSDSEESLI